MLPRHNAEINFALIGKDAMVWHAGALPLVFHSSGRKTTGTVSSVVGRIPTAKGAGLTFSDVAGAGVDFADLFNFVPAGAFSFLVVAAPVSQSRISILASHRGNVGLPQISISANANQNNAVEAGTLAIRCLNNANVVQSIRMQSQCDGLAHAWAGYHNSSSTGKGWRDGVQQTLVTTASISGDYVTAKQFRVGNFANYTSTGFNSVEPVSLVVMWPRQMPDALLKQLSARPESVFMPHRKPFLGLPASFSAAWARGANVILQPGARV